MQIDRLACDQDPYLREMRRMLHAHPELSWSEIETTAAIAKELAEAGWSVHRFPEHTGLTATLMGKGKTKTKLKTLVLRADIDALPVIEKTELPFESRNLGIMHACGHDAHTAMLLGAARILKQVQDQWAGELRLLFQPAEEINEGAKYCVSQGAVEGADAIFGMHIWGDLPAPLINVQAGPRMASCDQFQITVQGISAHGGMPHQGVDAFVTAAAIIGNIQTLVSRNNDPREPLVITIGAAGALRLLERAVAGVHRRVRQQRRGDAPHPEADPERLLQAFGEGLAAAFPDLPATVVHCEHFRPGRPVPTHRMPAAV